MYYIYSIIFVDLICKSNTSTVKEEIKNQVLELIGILEPDLVKAVEKDSETVLRFAANRIARIKRLVDEKTLERVVKGELAAEEETLKMLTRAFAMGRTFDSL